MNIKFVKKYTVYNAYHFSAKSDPLVLPTPNLVKHASVHMNSVWVLGGQSVFT